MKKYGFGGESSTYVFVAAVAIFSTILGFSFGATWRGSVFESAPFGWAEFWLSRYQTGLTIIVAVLIAKQQMDAARRQHVAQVKRSFQKEIDALDALYSLSNMITNYKGSFAYGLMALANPRAFPSLREPSYFVRQWPDSLHLDLKIHFEKTLEACDAASAASHDRNISDQDVAVHVKRALIYADHLSDQVQSQRERLAQYWS